MRVPGNAITQNTVSVRYSSKFEAYFYYKKTWGGGGGINGYVSAVRTVLYLKQFQYYNSSLVQYLS